MEDYNRLGTVVPGSKAATKGGVMGQCGCGDFDPDFKFKGPGDIVYVLQVYPSCDYCQTPAGVIIYAFAPDDQKLWRCDRIREVKIQDIGTAFGIVDPAVLAKKLERTGFDIEGVEVDFNHAFLDAVNEQILVNQKIHKQS